jgi:hypothetical protein
VFLGGLAPKPDGVFYMKISQESLYSLRDNDFKLLHYTMKNCFALYDFGSINKDVMVSLNVQEDEFLKSISRLQELGYLTIFNGIVFTNNLEIV